MSQELNNRLVIYSFGENEYDRETDPRAHCRERPGESPQVLHGGPRLREARGLSEPRQPSLAHGRAEGDRRRDDSLRRQVQAGSARASRGGEGGGTTGGSIPTKAQRRRGSIYGERAGRGRGRR